MADTFEFRMSRVAIDSWRVYPIRRSRRMMFMCVVLPRVGKSADIRKGLLINIVACVAVEEIADLEGAASGDQMTDGVGVPERDVGG